MTHTTLFCIPHAGGGASAFRRWSEALESHIQLKVLQSRGRESRFNEPPLADLDAVVGDLYALMEPHLGPRFALFGHSMGALLAFELAQMARARTGHAPSHLFASSCRAPSLPQTTAPIARLPDADFVTELMRRYGGIPASILADQDYMAAVLPAIRADFTILEDYRRRQWPLLDCPISVFAGRADGVIPRSTLLGWRNETTGAFALEMLEGDHFYLQSQRNVLASLVSSALEQPAKVFHAECIRL
ncbi:MAG: thioesterase [Acetobacteraceae bacterium]|nr:thioesterase [Acetobacteraceae bacterium]